MAKKKKKKLLDTRSVLKKTKTNFFTSHPNWSAALILFLLLIIFYYPIVFEDKTLLPPDKVTAKLSRSFAVDTIFNDGTYPLWNPYIFSGMPSFASLSSTPFINLVDTAINYTIIGIGRVIPLTPFMRIIFNYVIFGLLVYLLLKSFKVNRYACLFAAIAVVFVPQYVAFTAYGHNTKFLTLALIPLIFWAVHNLLNKRNLLFFVLTALALGFQLLRAHVQVCYYTYILIGLYFIYFVISEYIKTKQYKPQLTGFGLLLGAGALALLLSSVMYISIYEYSHFSIRGGGASGGLDYDYASSWSFSPIETITFLIPSFLGFGGSTYWGKMPFTDYPLYMGVVTLFLAGLAFVIKRDRYTVFFGIIAIFSLLVSFGKHFPILYDPMFNLLPFFNKFRIPSMIHILLDLAVIIIAGLGLNHLINLKESDDKKMLANKSKNIKIYVYSFGSIAVLLMLIVGLGKGMLLNSMESIFKLRHPNISLQQIEQLKGLAYKAALTDTVVMLILLGITGFLVMYFLNSKMKANMLGVGLILLLIIDLWIVDFKIVNPQPAVDETAFFQKTNTVEFLEKQDGHFRIFPVNINQPGEKPDNWWMYYKLKNIYGYHAAKIKIYQETMTELNFPQNYLFKFLGQGVDDKGQRTVQFKKPEQIPPDQLFGHQNFLNMLNTKYLISKYPIPDTSCHLVHQGDNLIYENRNALSPAFFVNDVKILNSKEEIFRYFKSKDFNAANTAILEEKPELAIQPSTGNNVTLVSSDIHNIRLKASVVVPALMVLSEIYYPAGWNAYVDGVKTKIYKTNYILRSIFLQPGEHEIEFKFEPNSFKLGLFISLATFLILIVALVFSVRRLKKND
jgi:hypothetical protein